MVLLPALCLVATLAACAGSQGQPRSALSAEPDVYVDVTEPVVADVTMAGPTVAMEYTLYNPTAKPVVLVDTGWSIVLGGKEVAVGRTPFNLRMGPGARAKGKLRYDVPMPFQPNRLQPGLKAEFSSYQIFGDFTIQESDPPGTRKLTFRTSGAVLGHLLPPVDITVSAIRFVRERQPREGVVELHIQLEVENPNPFPIRVGQIDYSCSIERRKVIEESIMSGDRVKPGSTMKYKAVRLVGKEDMFDLAKLLIQAPRLSFAAQGTAMIEGADVPFGVEGDIHFLKDSED